jgi:hypothetical protein
MSVGSSGFTKLVQATVLASFIAIPANDVWAESDFTAGKLVNELKPSELYIFVSGVVEGLAHARYLKDGKQTEGMNCILDWFYKDKATIDTITKSFKEYSDFSPAGVTAALAKKKCGE